MDLVQNLLHALAEESDTAGYYDPGEMNAVAEAYLAGEDSERLRGAADAIFSRWHADLNSADKSTREHAKDFKAHVLINHHA